jgi:Bacterial Ig-like domain
MASTSINASTRKLFKVGTTAAVDATISYSASARRATLNPNANLQLGTEYRAVVTTGVRDLAGNQLDQDPDASGRQKKEWFFRVRN